ncbi:MAG: hypothetical protein MI922_14225, partial [Bacteroidales bacterium]|nr:hypothetical protein [Bacteroidales bacterium]
MKAFSRLISIILIGVITLGSSAPKRIDYTKGKNNNVCKVLKNNVLVYVVFVDTKTTSPWTEFDIQSTIDSMEHAVQWLENQVGQRGVALNIISDFYIGSEYTTVNKTLPMKSVEESALSPNMKNGLRELNKWGDYVARIVGADMRIEAKDGIPQVNNPKNKERLLALLRDEKQVESVALLYLVNNYFRDDISICLNHLDDEDVEFAIVSYKYPATIVQNILNLFGAADLHKTIYRRNEKKIKLCEEYFPKDIMQDVYEKNLSSLEIGALTEYLIGWTEDLDSKYRPLLNDNFVNF